MFEKIPTRNLSAVVFAVLTVSIMALFYNIYEPWQPIGPELIPDGSFSTPAATNAFSGWNNLTRLVADGGYKGSPGVVLTTSSNENGILRFTIYNLTNIPVFRASLRAAAHGIIRGKEGYHVPWAFLYYHDANAKPLYGPHHSIMEIHKDSDWRYYKGFIPIPKGAADARFYVQNLGRAGIMQIDDLSVIPVRARPFAPFWKLFFGTVWSAAFVVCLSVLRPWARRYGFLIMATLFLIIIGIVLPGKPLDEAIEKTAQTVKTLTPKPKMPQPSVQLASTKPVKPKDETIAMRNTIREKTHIVGHFVLFSLLAFLSALSWVPAPPSLKRAAAVLAGLAFFAAATEVLQFIPPDRSARLSDLHVDMVGMAGAVTLVFFLRNIQHLISRVCR